MPWQLPFCTVEKVFCPIYRGAVYNFWRTYPTEEWVTSAVNEACCWSGELIYRWGFRLCNGYVIWCFVWI